MPRSRVSPCYLDSIGISILNLCNTNRYNVGPVSQTGLASIIVYDTIVIYASQIGFRFSEPDFTRNLDLSQSQNPLLLGANAQYLKALILGRLFYTRPLGSGFVQSKNQNFRQTCPGVPGPNLP